MNVYAHEPSGLTGNLVTVEVDIRHGIPGIEIVGLPAGAVRESRERVRVSAGHAGFKFPVDRVLVNLAPSDLPKAGSAYDFPIALAILASAGLIPDPGVPILALGELTLDGSLRPVRAVLPAVIDAIRNRIECVLIPAENASEASIPCRGSIWPIRHLSEIVEVMGRIREGGISPGYCNNPHPDNGIYPDYSMTKGNEALKRALVVAVTGKHNILLYGPPGTGKTLAASSLPGIFPPLDEEAAMEVASTRSLAGLSVQSLPKIPPFRAPHHTSTLEGMTGGGKHVKPGEISLANHGILFLDETPEFRRDVLQALREPVEDGFITLSRAGCSIRFPSSFQLVLAANACPCGNLGAKGLTCLCSGTELARYWKRIGGPLLDRIDIRIRVGQSGSEILEKPSIKSSEMMRNEVIEARNRGKKRKVSAVTDTLAIFDDKLKRELSCIANRLSLSPRAVTSVLRLAQTIADVDDKDIPDRDSLFEAIQYRRFAEGETDFNWENGIY